MSAIPGIRSGRIARHGDERGIFRELWRSSAFGALDPAETGPTAEVAAGRVPRFVQANLSSSAPGSCAGCTAIAISSTTGS